MGCALPEGATGNNIARASRDLGRLSGDDGGNDDQPLLLVRPSGDRHGRAADHDRSARRSPIGSGVESISLVQMGGMNLNHFTEEHLMQVKPALWMSMIETAEIVAERYKVSRERQDDYALESQRRTAAAQQAGKFKDEIVPLADQDEKNRQGDRPGKSIVDVTVDRDECNRPDTTLEGLSALKPVLQRRPADRSRASTSPPATPRSSPTALRRRL